MGLISGLLRRASERRRTSPGAGELIDNRDITADTGPLDQSAEDNDPRSVAAVSTDEADGLRDAGDYERAAAAYEALIAVAPERNDLRVQLGNMLKDSGRLAEAEATYRAALARSPDDADIYLQLGHALKLQGRRPAAEEAYRRAAKLSPLAPEPVHELQLIEAALYEAEFKKLFLKYYLHVPPDTPMDAGQETSFHDNFSHRYEYFNSGVIPWLDRFSPLKGSRIIEVGSGTGSSTEALLGLAGYVVCFEPDPTTIPLAKLRLARRGWKNFEIHQRTFDAEIAATLAPADGVLLGAVLEHTSFSECIEILTSSWKVLKPGGWLCVADTPNRLSPIDHHTSRLPFFASLPAEVRINYAHYSPRSDFAGAFPAGSAWCDSDYHRLTRWGIGISYHEFELALGPGVHDWIIADGYEPEIKGLIGMRPEDQMIISQVEMFAPNVHKAFTRQTLHLIMRKPLDRKAALPAEREKNC